jgi:hypothetical protein
MATEVSDHESFAIRHRGGVMFERYDIDLHLHPYLGYALARNHRSAIINTDEEGFRHADSPFGSVDGPGWRAAGGGGVVLGNSTAFGMAATCDHGTVASHLALLRGDRQLNLGVVGGNSVQEVIAALPYLDLAETVVVFSGAGDYWTSLASWTPHSAWGPLFFEGTLTSLTRIPLFQLAAVATGVDPDWRPEPQPKPDAAERPDFTDVVERVEAAAARQVRNLSAVRRLARPDARVLFALQPFATPRSRKLTAAEMEHFDFHMPMFGQERNRPFEHHWGRFAELVAKGCADLGVPFTDLSADRFEGFAFSDHFHLTDEGNRQAAVMIHEALAALPAPAVHAPNPHPTTPAS